MSAEVYETHIECPYCGERLSILVDTSDAGNEYIEDCQVCCRPIVVNAVVGSDGALTVGVTAENE